MEGSNTHKERTRIVKSFQEDPSVRVFLVSLKTAGVGLNLVAANKVFLMDPWWNPAV
jgi:SNF2 family DNA or RNA helicase